MDPDFWKIVVACTFACLLVVGFLYGMYNIAKAEDQHRDTRLGWYGLVLLPMLLVLAGFYLFKEQPDNRLANISGMTLPQIIESDPDLFTDEVAREVNKRLIILFKDSAVPQQVAMTSRHTTYVTRACWKHSGTIIQAKSAVSQGATVESVRTKLTEMGINPECLD